jgi:putative spermidine/putrescine transport system ATP-binding protein
LTKPRVLTRRGPERESKGYAERRFRERSGGQAQRVVIARALAPKPALLLLDEPLSALDAKPREELTHEIADIHHETLCTTLLMTHDHTEAMTIADNVLLMNVGEIVRSGSPLELYRHPKTLFAANFIGTKNVLPCVVIDNKGPTCVRLESTSVTLRPKLTLSFGLAHPSGFAFVLMMLERT